MKIVGDLPQATIGLGMYRYDDGITVLSLQVSVKSTGGNIQNTTYIPIPWLLHNIGQNRDLWPVVTTVRPGVFVRLWRWLFG